MRAPLPVPPHLVDGVKGCLIWASQPPDLPPRRPFSARRPDRDINLFRCAETDLRLREEREKQPVSSVRTRGFMNAFAATQNDGDPPAHPVQARPRRLWPWQRQKQLNLFEEKYVNRRRARVHIFSRQVPKKPIIVRHCVENPHVDALHPPPTKMPARPATSPPSRVKRKIAEMARRFVDERKLPVETL